MWQRGACMVGVCMVGGVRSTHASPATHAPHVDRTTDTCKNITFPQTSFAGGNKWNRIFK